MPSDVQATCLLTSDGGPLTGELSARLRADGWRVVILQLEPAALPAQASPDAYGLADDSEQELRRTLGRILTDHPAIDAFIHLDPSANDAPGTPAWKRARCRLRSVFLAAGELKRTLATAGNGPRKAFMTVARLDGAFGLRQGDHSPLAAALFGLTKSLDKEWSDTFCRALDLAPSLPAAEAAAFVVQELYDPNRLLMQVGYDGSARRTLAEAEEPALAETTDSIPQGAVFLVSGGARGVTATCVLELARQHRASFVLVGRSPVDGPEPVWAQGCTDAGKLSALAADALRAEGAKPTPVKIQQLVGPLNARREALQVIAELERHGSRVKYIACDVTDAAALAPALREAERELGKITGLIHGAGVLADKFIEKKTGEDFDRVFDTKVLGLAALLECIDPAALRHVALFSSVAGFYGNRGQADYAMANEVLNSWAIQLAARLPSCRVVSFNWGPWEGGMVTPTLQRLFEEHGVKVIGRAHGAEIFVDALHAPRAETPHLIVGSGTPVLTPPVALPGRKHQLARKLELALNPAVQHHRIGEHVVLPIVHVAAWFATSCENLFPGYGFFRMEELKMLKGIVFNEKLPERFDLTIEEQASGADEVCLSGFLSARNRQDRLQPFYSARVRLRRKAVARTRLERFDLRADPAWAERDPYTDGTLFHGPAFQAISRILNVHERGMTVECLAKPLREDLHGQFETRVLDPYTADAAFQAILIWVRHAHGAASLPVSVDAGEFYLPPAYGAPFYVTLTETASTKATAAMDVSVHDEHGNQFGFLVGAKVAISRLLDVKFHTQHVELP